LVCCGREPKYYEISLRLGGGLEEEHSPISEDWGHSRVEMGFEKEYAR